MLRTLFLVIFLLPFCAASQVDVSPKAIDEVALDGEAPPYKDVLVRNHSDEPVFILRVSTERDMYHRLSTKKVPPDSTAIVRLIMDIRKMGSFQRTVEVFLSNRRLPVEVKLVGEVTGVYDDPRKQCPDFDQRIRVPNELKVVVLDSSTKEPIPGARVRIEAPSKGFKGHTDREGTLVQQVPQEDLLVAVNKKEYGGKSREVKMDKREKKVVFLLHKEKEEEETEEEVPTEVDTTDKVDPPIVQRDTIRDKEEAPSDTLPEDALDPDLFRPNNVVFLVDVSTSMKNQDKLELLQTSMLELLKILRPRDQVALVAYSTDARVLLSPHSAGDKERIREAIEELEAGGTTAGKKGIRKAFRIARWNSIEDGNDQVIIATDGAFNQDPDRVGRIVDRNYSRGVRMSVVGIKNDEWTEDAMEDIAKKGHGAYIHLEDEEKAKAALVEEIKKRSRKK